jgi:type VI secretion system protein ImpG
LRLTKADYSPYNGVLDDAVADTPRPPKAVLRLRFETTLGSVAALSIDRIPLYLRGSHPFPAKLYEHITGHTVAVLITPAKTAASRHMTLPPDCIRPLGFDDQEALLPVSHRDFHGHRLLHEYFAFPERFLFLELADLRDALGRCDTQAFDVVLVLDHWDATLENRVDASNFALYCTPVINLFPHRTDRMAVHDGQHDYRLIVDRMRPRDFEVHTVEVVRGKRKENLSDSCRFITLSTETRQALRKAPAIFRCAGSCANCRSVKERAGSARITQAARCLSRSSMPPMPPTRPICAK